MLTSGLPFDQAIIYEDTRHLHVSHVTGRVNRNQFLVHLESGKYVHWNNYTGKLRRGRS